MMKLREVSAGMVLEDWACRFVPSDITLIDQRTGAELQEISLVAARYRVVEEIGRDPSTGVERTFTHREVHEFLAVGREALSYANDSDVVIFSPLRRGQIANYNVAEKMFKMFLQRLSPGMRLMKPVVCIHVQKHTTEVEERALVDLGVQCGARKVLLYQEPLSVLLDHAHQYKDLKHALVLHIEARDLPGEERE